MSEEWSGKGEPLLWEEELQQCGSDAAHVDICEEEEDAISRGEIRIPGPVHRVPRIAVPQGDAVSIVFALQRQLSLVREEAIRELLARKARIEEQLKELGYKEPSLPLDDDDFFE